MILIGLDVSDHQALQFVVLIHLCFYLCRHPVKGYHLAWKPGRRAPRPGTAMDPREQWEPQSQLCVGCIRFYGIMAVRQRV